MGDRIKRPKLAETLKLIAERGPFVFYNGNLTDKLVEEITKFKGIITKRDFQEYRCALRFSILVFSNIMHTRKVRIASDACYYENYRLKAIIKLTSSRN